MAATDTTSLGRDAATKPDERRRHPRVGALWMATVHAVSDVHDCMVIDVSRGGAKLMLSQAHPLTEIRALVVGALGTFRARLVWQRGEFAGVQFLDPPEKIADAFGGMLP